MLEPDPMEMLSLRRLAELMDVSRDTIRRMVRRGTFPKPIDISALGQTKKWLRRDIEAWLEARRPKPEKIARVRRSRVEG